MLDYNVLGPAAQTTGNNIMIPANAPFDASDYASITLGITTTVGITGGVLVFEQSLDGSNWIPLILFDQSTMVSSPITSLALSASMAKVLAGSIAGRLIRVRVSSNVTGGTVQVWSLLSQLEFNNPATNVTANVIGGSSSNGCLNYRKLSTADTNSNLVKSGSGKIQQLIVSNTSAAAKFLKLYNKASAPVVGTDIPYLTILIPAGQTLTLIPNDIGLYFSAGIGYGITGAVADADTTAVAIADVSINMQYA